MITSLLVLGALVCVALAFWSVTALGKTRWYPLSLFIAPVLFAAGMWTAAVLDVKL